MSKQTEALKLALEALNRNDYLGWQTNIHVREAIREALAEQPARQQEPYGQVTVVRRPGCVDQHWFYRWPEPPYLDNAAECHTVYTSPPASKPWVGLTQEDMYEIGEFRNTHGYVPTGFKRLVAAIEAKLREKNE